MNFVEYSTDLYSDLSHIPTIILQSEANTLYVNSITICNTSTNDIRINLTKTVLNGLSPTASVFIAKNILIPSVGSGKANNINTINLVKLLGLDLFLPVNVVDTVLHTTVISCYSNGIGQNFDCTVDFTSFNETPLGLANR